MGVTPWQYAFNSPGAAVAGMLAARPDGEAPASEQVSLADACGRILAADVLADRDSPPFDYSALDGYAVRSADLRSLHADKHALPVVGDARIGERPPHLPAFTSDGPLAMRVATGAPMPTGADAVLRREDVTEHGSPVSSISITRAVIAGVRAGDAIRLRAENARAGTVVVPAGTIINPGAVGTMAAVGCTRPRVHARVRVALITTGDEVTPIDTPASALGDFQIRNSNGPALCALLASRPWLTSTTYRHVRDDDRTLTDALHAATGAADAVILTGGVSMGHRDPVRGVVETLGARMVFHGLPQRPGKPMLGAWLERRGLAPAPIFGLPGNPVSALVTCTRIALPVLAACAGVRHAHTPTAARIAIANPDHKTLDLWWHRLVRRRADGLAELVDVRGSGDIVAAGLSSGFVEVPPGVSLGADPGATHLFLPWTG